METNSEVEALKALIGNILKQDLVWEDRTYMDSPYWIIRKITVAQATVATIVAGLAMIGTPYYKRTLLLAASLYTEIRIIMSDDIIIVWFL